MLTISNIYQIFSDKFVLFVDENDNISCKFFCILRLTFPHTYKRNTMKVRTGNKQKEKKI